MLAHVDPYASGVLSREKHGRLVEAMDTLCPRAGLGGDNKAYLWRSVADLLTEDEIGYIRDYRIHAMNGKYGLVYMGKGLNSTPIQVRMMAMVACFMRNFVDARIVYMGDLLRMLQSGDSPEGSVICVPDFFVASEAKETRAWQIQLLHTFLLNRITEGDQTVLYVDDPTALDKVYGTSLRNTLQSRNFYRVKAE